MAFQSFNARLSRAKTDKKVVRLSGKRYNHLINSIKQCSAVAASGAASLIAGPDGIASRTIGSTGETATSQAVGRFRFKVMSGNYIICRTWDGVVEGDTDINVAKPYLLQVTPFDGQVHGGISYIYTSATNRTAQLGTITEEQVVIPYYIADDQIWAVKDPIGGIGVSGANEWLDLNLDGRAWAMSVYSD